MLRRHPRLRKVLLGVVLGVLVCAAAVMGLVALVVAGLSSEDGFADDLVIPAGVDAAEPIERDWTADPRTPQDRFQTAVFEALERPGDGDPSLVPELGHLIALHRETPETLERYLATHPGWRVHRDRNGRFATRRWAIAARWRPSLNGFYSGADFHVPFSAPTPSFDTRLTIGLSGQPSFERARLGGTRPEFGITSDKDAFCSIGSPLQGGGRSAVRSSALAISSLETMRPLRLPAKHGHVQPRVTQLSVRCLAIMLKTPPHSSGSPAS